MREPRGERVRSIITDSILIWAYLIGYPVIQEELSGARNSRLGIGTGHPIEDSSNFPASNLRKNFAENMEGIGAASKASSRMTSGARLETTLMCSARA